MFEHAVDTEIGDLITRLINRVGSLLQIKGRYIEAELLFRRALAIEKARYGPEHPEVVRSVENLVSLLERMNNHWAAAGLLAEFSLAKKSMGELFSEVGRIRKAQAAPNHAEDVTSLTNRAKFLLNTNRRTEAEPLFRRALTICDAIYGFDHPEVAASLRNLALSLCDSDRIAEAELLLRRALAIHQASYGSDHPDFTLDLKGLAAVLKKAGRLSEAESLFRQALDSDWDRGDELNAAIDLINLADLRQAAGALSEAEEHYRQALVILETYSGAECLVTTILIDLAELLRATNRPGEAESHIQQARSIDQAINPQNITGLYLQALVMETTNRLSEAEALFRRALARLTPLTARGDSILQECLACYVRVLRKLGETEAQIDAGVTLVLESVHEPAP
jgi:tetratricopeptide (TPR) repeat protein